MADRPSTADLAAAFENLCNDPQLGRPICCEQCGLVLRPEQLRDQVTAYLERKFHGHELTPEVRDQLVAEISPWWDWFRAGENICFSCGVSEGQKTKGG